MIDRSTTRDIPSGSVALYEVAILFGTPVAETILASVHVRAHRQAGHMDAQAGGNRHLRPIESAT